MVSPQSAAARALAAGDHQSVQPPHIGECVAVEGHPRRTGHRPAVPRDQADVIAPRHIAVGDLERADRPGGVEQLEIGEDQNAYRTHGGIRGINVISARR